MPDPRPEVMDFLLTRRSRPAKTLTGPGPNRATLRRILTAAARSPDHGKLEPWRFIVLEGAATEQLARLIEELGPARGEPEEKIAKAAAPFRDCPVTVAVVSAPKPSDKIPEIEQKLSAGAVCLSLLNAALASGWGANWLTGWMAHDAEFLARGLGVRDGFVAGFVHIGTETSAPPERPRPDLDTITEWRGA